MGTGGRVGWLVAALALAAGAACGGPGGEDGGGSGGDGDDAPVRASIQESTLFATQRAFGLTLAPATDRDVRVGAIQLRSPLFAEVEPQVRDTRVRATDRAVVMPLRYGEAVCDGVEAGDVEAPVLATDVDGEDVRVPLDQRPADLLAGIHAAECASAGVLEDVELRLGDEWVPTAPRTLAGTLEVSQRHAGVEAAVEPLEGNVIFGVTAGAADGGAGGDAWLAVSDAAPAATGAVEVRAARCDAHALIEYKRTFVFTVRVAVGDAEPVLVDVEAEGAARTALESLLASCLG
jgi:hypothetical protein